MRNVLLVATFMVLASFLAGGPALGVETYGPYFLASDVVPDVYVAKDVFFLRPWGSNTPSSSYVDICTTNGLKYFGRLVKISDYEITLSQRYIAKKSGQRVEKPLVVPKAQVVILRIYW